MRFKLHCIFILILLSSLSYAQEASRIEVLQNELEVLSMKHPKLEEKVNVNITNTTLSNFLLAIAKVHEVNLNVSPELNSINIINNFSDVNIRDLLVFLAKQYNLSLDITGNIISVSKYSAPTKEPVEKVIVAEYDAASEAISMDLRNDPLEKVFRRITDVSGKNLVFAPGMEQIPLSIYLNKVPFESAMEKLALANNLEVTRSRDGFFIFNSLDNGPDGQGVNRAIRISDNFYYQVLDSLNKVVEVDFKNVPVSDIIYSIGNDLNLDIFTASPLSNMGSVSVNAERIHFDVLLEKIFQSINNQNSAIQNSDPGRPDQRNRGDQNYSGSSTTSKAFTFKKEGNMYYFGIEAQLALKTTEVVQLMHRSIEMLSNPSGNYRQRRQDRNRQMSGTTNYYANGNNRNSTNNNPPTNYNNDSGGSSYNEEVSTEAIQKIIPDELMTGIDIKVDSELNSFVVSGPAARIERFKNFIKYIDKPVPVILIEVMILEVNRSALVETGVSFGLGEEPVETQGQAFPSANMRLGAKTVNRVIGGFDGFGTLNMGKVLPNFYMDIKAMESNGNLKILSTPKLSTLNGHKAHLSSGQTTYYAVTNQNFFGSQIPQSSEITNYYPIDAELALDIMPFVSGDGEITLDINVVQSSFNGERIAENAPPGMNSREFSSIIRMRDKDVAILGGIEQRTKDDSGSGVPLLARVPVLKWLFSERRREDSKKKLNILIKPTVIY